MMIVDDPAKGICESNVIFKTSDVACKHLLGSEPGKFACAVHSKRWYRRTPCFSHGQIEANKTRECRMGRYVLDHAEEVNVHR